MHLISFNITCTIFCLSFLVSLDHLHFTVYTDEVAAIMLYVLKIMILVSSQTQASNMLFIVAICTIKPVTQNKQKIT